MHESLERRRRRRWGWQQLLSHRGRALGGGGCGVDILGYVLECLASGLLGRAEIHATGLGFKSPLSSKRSPTQAKSNATTSPLHEEPTPKMLDWVDIQLLRGRRRYGHPPHSTLTRISRTKLIKGPVPPCELEALLYIRAHTSIPIPTVHAIYQRKQGLFLKLSWATGQSLFGAWRGLSEAQREVLREDLRGYVGQLRALRRLKGEERGVGSCAMGALRDHRVGYGAYGPFESVEGFHALLRGGFAHDAVGMPAVVTRVHGRGIGKAEGKGEAKNEDQEEGYRVVLTHADLHPDNIIVDPSTGRISAIVDWEFAGWYPEYWEYTKAHYGWAQKLDWLGWTETVTRMLDGRAYEEEQEAERVLQERFDDLPG